MKIDLDELLADNRSAHLLYAFNSMTNYIKKVVQYIIDGVANQQTIILIENERYLPLVMKELKVHLNDTEMTDIHIINNFDFYFSTGCYHPPAILGHIEKMYMSLLEQNKSIRTWTHVEWSTIEGPLKIVEELEKVVDQLSADMGLTIMCAYDEERMPESLKLALYRTHKFILSDDGVDYSKFYKMENAVEI
ncbi:MEDS domain-containing protein [Fictibacillus phosphorivorans]|uniref:MEDS domain-containing protein n=1 Tax=Fictibacillus phosphorivorans TaxID=1221500 RepID=UPI00204006FA|nr:MEDS domain-containing protein [Fictibacillus phosphorivorans]MCM3718619.1 MEDS domain-containing protein [Fictibacillus phosphorivorans]MCM3776242.1 MEDS domain-containing protein [Fictibacillus phosphorivorans]